MQKLFHFDSEPGVYQSDAALVFCFDDRFTLAVRKFLKRRGLVRTDSIRIAGGPKPLASPRDEGERAFVLDQLRLSRRLHGTGRVVLIAHSDCGAYGGLAKFSGDTQAEADFHSAELSRAAAAVRSAIPDVEVECLLADFSGLWRVEAALSRSAG